MEYQTFLIHLSVWPTAILLSAWIIAKFIWCPMREQKLLPPPPYEELYLIDEEEKKNIITKKMGNNFVIENTPSGICIMKYSVKNEGFVYWADKVISYKYLETVARKYVKTFHCVNLYIDRKEQIKKKQERIAEAKKKREEMEEDPLFATFKTYDKVSYHLVAEIANKFIQRGKFKEAFKFIENKKKPTIKDKMNFALFKRMGLA